MSIRFIMKNGVEFTIKCTEFTLTKNGLGAVNGYEISGVTENKPLYIDWAEVAAVIRIMTDESK